jgi:hypothetical protein
MKVEKATGELKEKLERLKEKDYGKITVELDGIKASVRREMRTKHYDTVVGVLVESIQDFWRGQEEGKLEIDEDFEFSVKGQMEHDWQHTIKKPPKNSWIK